MFRELEQPNFISFLLASNVNSEDVPHFPTVETAETPVVPASPIAEGRSFLRGLFGNSNANANSNSPIQQFLQSLKQSWGPNKQSTTAASKPSSGTFQVNTVRNVSFSPQINQTEPVPNQKVLTNNNKSNPVFPQNQIAPISRGSQEPAAQAGSSAFQNKSNSPSNLSNPTNNQPKTIASQNQTGIQPGPDPSQKYPVPIQNPTVPVPNPNQIIPMSIQNQTVPVNDATKLSSNPLNGMPTSWYLGYGPSPLSNVDASAAKADPKPAPL